ncbi:MAG: succinate dehydrogenase [Anaerolineae bacterium]|nr:succinate dehydrogenase [Anaerolineae bacterium]
MTTVIGTAKRKVTIRQVQIQANSERYAYLFMRMSGVALLVLAVGHMLIQHVLNSSGNLTLLFVADQWNSWGWRAYDMFLLAFAVAHGLNGLRNVLEDYIHNPNTTKWISRFLVAFGIITIIWAGIGIASFDSEAARAAQEALRQSLGQ